MKNILFVAHDDPGQESRLQCAVDVVRAVGGHLNCLDVTVLPAATGDFAAGTFEREIFESVIIAEQANRDRIVSRLTAEGLPFSCKEATGGMVETIMAYTLLNDLVVVGTHAPLWEAGQADVAAQIVRPIGRPILAVPRRAKSLDLSGTALVAWDGSAPADAALRAAVPLLRLAKHPVICCVGGDNMRASLKDAEIYCSRHGLSVETEMLPTGFDKRDRTILIFARSLGATWIAMGAFGHSKLREDFIGGVTRAMIENSEIPLFMAH